MLLRNHRADDTVTNSIAKTLRAELIVDDTGLLPVAAHAAEVLHRPRADLNGARNKNPLRCVLTQLQLALEWDFAGALLSRAVVLDLLIHNCGPIRLAAAGRGRVLKWAPSKTRKDRIEIVNRIFLRS